MMTFVVSRMQIIVKKVRCVLWLITQNMKTVAFTNKRTIS